MKPFRSYLVQALINWTLDNEMKPELVLDCDCDDVEVPKEFITPEGTMVLNVSPSAVRNFSLTAAGVECDTCFHGVVHHIRAPILAIMDVLAEGHTLGLSFEVDEVNPNESTAADLHTADLFEPEVDDKHEQARSKFKIVK